MTEDAGRCPTCDSPKPHLHPAVQHEGEVQICRDLWHGAFNKPITADPEAPAGAAPPPLLAEVERARNAVSVLRDAVREGRVIGFRDRDDLVMAIHHALDMAAAAVSRLPPQPEELSFADLRATNLARLASSWPTEDPWAPWDWTNATAGEVGEACVEGLALLTALSAKAGAASNLTKKMNRVWPSGEFTTSWDKPEDQRLDELSDRLADELADVVIYADLLASKLGRSLGECVRQKFNEKSDQIGSTVKLLAARLPPAPAHIDADCEVARGVGWMCTCQTPAEKAEDAQYRAECEAERDAAGAPAPAPAWQPDKEK